jgi:hypothetical protein
MNTESDKPAFGILSTRSLNCRRRRHDRRGRVCEGWRIWQSMLALKRQLWRRSHDLRSTDIDVTDFAHGRHFHSRRRLDDGRLIESDISVGVDRVDVGSGCDDRGRQSRRRIQSAPVHVGCGGDHWNRQDRQPEVRGSRRSRGGRNGRRRTSPRDNVGQRHIVAQLQLRRSHNGLLAIVGVRRDRNYGLRRVNRIRCLRDGLRNTTGVQGRQVFGKLVSDHVRTVEYGRGREMGSWPELGGTPYHCNRCGMKNRGLGKSAPRQPRAHENIGPEKSGRG